MDRLEKCTKCKVAREHMDQACTDPTCPKEYTYSGLPQAQHARYVALVTKIETDLSAYFEDLFKPKP